MDPGEALPRRTGPVLLVFLLAATVVWWVWGAWSPVPIVHDEAAYLLQARIFSRGHLIGDRPPLPFFFEQFHVLTDPGLAAKYPPGFAALLSLGVLVGLPALIPVLIAGGSAALLFSFLRRRVGDLLAITGVLLWLGAPGSLVYRPSYLSEGAAELAFLLGLWIVDRRAGRDGARSVMWLGAVAAAAALIRPYTALALFAPLLLRVCWAELRDRRHLRALMVAAVSGGAVLGLWFAWSAGTTGHALESPYARYTSTRFPFEVLGFRTNRIELTDTLPAEFTQYREYHRAIQDAHTVARLPRIATERLGAIGHDLWGDALVLFLPLALIGALVPRGRALSLGGVVLFLAYLLKAHEPGWSTYYLSMYGGAAMLVVSGAELVGGRLRSRWERAPQGVATLLMVVSAALLMARVAPARRSIEERGRYQRQFAEAQQSLASRKAMVFVRYAPGHSFHQSLVRNDPFLSEAGVWVVNDRGEGNAALIAAVPSREPFLYEEVPTSGEPVRRLVPYPR